MVAWFSSNSDGGAKAAELYGAVVAQARSPAFYADCGISDTPEGRYEAIVLHLALVLERLSGKGAEAAAAVQALIETFVTDMDDSLREMGVGDLAVPRRVKRAAAGLYERSTLYGAAIAEADEGALARRLAECIPGLGAGKSATRLAAYVRTAHEHLKGLATSDLIAGRLSFPGAATTLARGAGGGAGS